MFIAFNSPRARFLPAPARRKTKRTTTPHAEPRSHTAELRAPHAEQPQHAQLPPFAQRTALGGPCTPRPALTGYPARSPQRLPAGTGLSGTLGPPLRLTWRSKPSRPWWCAPPSPAAALPRCPCPPTPRTSVLPLGRAIRTAPLYPAQLPPAGLRPPPSPPFPAVSANGAAGRPESTMGNVVRGGGSSPQPRGAACPDALSARCQKRDWTAASSSAVRVSGVSQSFFFLRGPGLS